MIMKAVFIPVVLISALIAGLVQTAHAHDPGLSVADVHILNETIRMQFSFSEKDISALIEKDRDQHYSINSSEVDVARAGLAELFGNGISLRYNDEPRKAKNIRVHQGAGGTIKVNLDYDYHASDRLALLVPLITQFSRGHRLHLTVRGNGGLPQLQKILSASSAPVLFGNIQTGGVTIFQQYLAEGVWHIWIGFDHILFLVTLLLPAVLVFRNQRWCSVDRFLPALVDTLKIVTAFTLAHSITLGLAVFAVIQPPVRLVESVIAFSVLVTAINNLRPVFPASRWLLAFGFGLIHGFGFANVLVELGLPAQSLLLSLVGFNIGVEAGQLGIVVLLIPLAYLIRHTVIYRKLIFSGGSVTAALIASVWMVERVSGIAMPGF